MSAHINKNVFSIWPGQSVLKANQPKDVEELLRTKLLKREAHILFLQNQIMHAKKVRRNLRWAVFVCIAVIVWQIYQGGGYA